MRQVLSVMASFVLLLTVFWGILGPAGKYHAAVGLAAWGLSDASAAVWGKRFGRHRLSHPLFDGIKTLEGTLAMIVASFAGIFITLTLLAGTPWVLNLAAPVRHPDG